MRCHECGFEAPPGMRFCGRCGGPLGSVCADCGFENRPGFLLCGQCSASLVSEPAPPGAYSAAGVAERRPVTVLFCDLVESTALACRLDPEELREVVVRYQQAAAAAIGRFAGYVAQYLGDGILVYFGYPEAQEECARRAVSSGLAIVDAVLDLNHDLRSQWDVELAVRVGIHSGLAVAGEVGAGGRTDQLFFGQTPNVAARLQGLAEPNVVVMSRATLDLVRGFFEYEELGMRQLKGFIEPIEIFRAVRESGVRTRFQLAVASGLTPMVGRRGECEFLADAFAEAEHERGQLVLVDGEAGIGKSRLQRWLKEHTAGRVDDWFTCYCSPYYQNTALNPLIDMLEGQLGFDRDDSAEERVTKLEAGLLRWGFSLADSVPYFAALLSLPTGERYPVPALSPPRLKGEIFARLLALPARAAVRRPVVLVVEDLHWADPSTLEFIGLLIQRLPGSRIVVLLTHRPEFKVPWPGTPHTTRIVLDRLADRETQTMVEDIAGGIPLPPEIVREIVSHTDGVPIFVEELTKMILDSGLVAELSGNNISNATKLRMLGIPSTLQDSLLSRLDRLGAGKEVAQLGAVLGRSFRYDVLSAVSELDEPSLKHHLQRLVSSDLFHQQGDLPDSTYIFKHALVQDAAYESLLRRRRRELHERVADVFREQFPEVAETEPEILAHHLEAGGRPEEAIGYSALAGKRAFGRSAYIEAISHFEKGLELLDGVPDSREHRQQELDLLLYLGLGLITTRGYAAESVERTYSRAMEVCEVLGDTPFQARFGIWAVAIVRGDREATAELAEWFRQVAGEVQDRIILLMSHSALGTLRFYRGEYALAGEHLKQAITLFDPARHHEVTREYAAGGGFFGHMVTTLLLWFTGFPDRANAHQEQVIALAETLSDPYTLAMALLYEANLAHETGDPDRAWAATERANRMLAESEHDFLFLAAVIKIVQGWELAQRGRVAEGVELLQRGLSSYRATGARILDPYYSGYLTEALLLADKHDEALPVVERAIELSRTNLDSFYEPELLRLRGEILWRLGRDRAKVESCYREVIALARSQGARSLQLRGATSLGKLLIEMGRAEEARDTLEAIYGRFTEGFDTRDLRNAQAVLQQLSDGRGPAAAVSGRHGTSTELQE